MFKNWPSVLFTIVILIGLGICLRPLDFVLINEVKAFISIIFGFATSCMLLSFIWLMQKKTSIPSPLQPSDIPSLDPRGRSNSTSSMDRHRRQNVSNISSLLDRPPNYEDALINSKPADWTQLHNDKCHHSSSSRVNRTDGVSICQKYSNDSSTNTSSTSSKDCSLCIDESISGAIINKTNQPNNSMAHKAFSIVKGFTTLDPGRQQATRASPQIRTGGRDHRKPSYSQLDVEQLMVYGSPPKYHDLPLGVQQFSGANHSNRDDCV